MAVSSFCPGPTVLQATEARLRGIQMQIVMLEEERRTLQRRLVEFAGSTMLECERIATRVEPYQRNPLPEIIRPDEDVHNADWLKDK